MQVTASLLADAAAVESGKLYVHGGAWDRIALAKLPATHPTMALVFVLRIEYSEALQDIPLRIELLDEDDVLVVPLVDGSISIGHAPRTTHGAPAFVPQAITFPGITFERTGRFRFAIRSGEEELASVPFEVMATSTTQSPDIQ